MDSLVLQTPDELTRSNADMVADSIIAKGYDNPIQAMVQVKYMTTIIDKVKDGLKERFKDEMFKAPGGKATAFGADIHYQNGYDEADYEQDAEYAELKAKLDQRKGLLKAAYKSGKPVLDGDVVIAEVLPTGKIVADKINISLRKQ